MHELYFLYKKQQSKTVIHKRRQTGTTLPADYTNVNTIPTVIAPTATVSNDTEVINITPTSNVPTGTPFTGMPPVQSTGIKPLIIPKGNLQTPSLAPVSQYTNAVNGSKVISQQEWLNALSSMANLQAFLTNVKPLKVSNPSANIISKIYTIDKFSWITINFQNKGHGYAYDFKYVSLPYPEDGGMLPDPAKYWNAVYLGGLNDLPTTTAGTPKIPGTPSIMQH